MALVYAKVQAEAQAIIAAAALVAETFHQVKQVLRHNSNLAIDWGAAELPEYIEVDAKGNLAGLTVTPAQLANALGSMGAFRDLFDNIELTWANPGDHMGNVNQIVPAQTSRVSVRS